MLKIFSKSDDKIQSQFIRYLLVGGAAFICDYVAMVTCTELLRFHYLLSATIGFLIGLAVNYAVSVIWVFSSRMFSNKFIEFAVFMVIGIAGLGINDVTIYIGYHIGIDYRIGKLFATATTLIFNFCARKFFLFRKK